MALWTKILFHAGKTLASNPELRARAVEAWREDVRPHAEAAWSRAKPKVDATREDIRRIREETPPGQNPGRFAGRVARRLIENVKGPKEPPAGK